MQRRFRALVAVTVRPLRHNQPPVRIIHRKSQFRLSADRENVFRNLKFAPGRQSLDPPGRGPAWLPRPKEKYAPAYRQPAAWLLRKCRQYTPDSASTWAT